MRKRVWAALFCAALTVVVCVRAAAASDFERDVIYNRQHRYYFDKEIKGETAEDSAWEFEFEVFKDATFTVDTEGQADLTLGANCDYDDVVLDRYPDAKLLFFNGNGDYFYHYGTLFLPAGPEAAFTAASTGRCTTLARFMMRRRAAFYCAPGACVNTSFRTALCRLKGWRPTARC